VVLDGLTGWLCGPQDLTATVDAALSDLARLRALGDAARAHAEASFSRGRLVADTERLYEQIASEKGL
jgi:glycosyltransferase involved in cell wall biosynthesis